MSTTHILNNKSAFIIEQVKFIQDYFAEISQLQQSSSIINLRIHKTIWIQNE